MPVTPPASGSGSTKKPREDPVLDDVEEPLLDELEDEHELIEEFEHIQRREAGLSDDAPPGHGPDKDDADLEDLIHEDGARSPYEEGGDQPADHELSIIDEDDLDFSLKDDERAPRGATPKEDR
ncbi:serine kinase/phosphatase [Pseudomonas sp. LPB0260]|uniref:serine kinase/phosphatase n=1 Tax=unclassified Pseudomonas TaxID=196821 RepID=UPI0015C2011B|nr:serine kinase/phosphatase [Pseudomonas sp. LPB0260]QLC73818.1 serine kinase/phosphatase [Pseudomonas sp. LPB0260]QLC76592.1 serine kinase/phosphatase [Pseudomonas sp. LPB0260]